MKWCALRAEPPMSTPLENDGIRITEVARRAQALPANAFVASMADTFLLWLPGDAEDDASKWTYKTTYIRPFPEANGRIALIDVKNTLVYPLRKAKKGAFADTVFVGRADSNDVCVNHTSISKLHSRIRRVAEGGWLLADAGSLNGTKINDRSVSTEVPMRNGDNVTFGALTYEVYEGKRLHLLLLRMK